MVRSFVLLLIHRISAKYLDLLNPEPDYNVISYVGETLKPIFVRVTSATRICEPVVVFAAALRRHLSRPGSYALTCAGILGHSRISAS